jgi:O-methyltransferase
VECGTWKGGMIAGIASILGKQRDYFLFDSFEGLPPAKKIDGAAAIAWQNDKNSEDYRDNCKASIEDARRAMGKAGIQDAKFVKGWFENTLPKSKFPQGIAILRMDADWYDSTYQILENLFEQVIQGGIIIIDDYFTWQGCAKAINDYLNTNNRKEVVEVFGGVAFIRKA